MADAFDSYQFEGAAVSAVAASVPEAELGSLRASFNLIRAANLLVQRLEAEVHRPAGWTMAGFRVMFCVWVGDNLEPRDIARLSGLSRAAVSSVLNTLERDGLIARTRESTDRRLVTVRLSADGETRLVAAYKKQNLLEQEFFAGLPAGSIEDFGGVLAGLLANDR